MPKKSSSYFRTILVITITACIVIAENAPRTALRRQNHPEDIGEQEIYSIDDDDTISLYDDDDILRDLVRENTTLEALFDHTAMTTYDKSEWALFFGIVLVAPLLVGITCALFHTETFATQPGETRNKRWSTRTTYREMADE